MGVLRKCICALAMTVAVNAAAQQITGSIRGSVTDASGAIVQSAAVTARHVETGLTRTAFSDNAGAYVLVELPVGHHRVTVGAETEHVQVIADAQLIQTTATSLGSVVNQRERLDLPAGWPKLFATWTITDRRRTVDAGPEGSRWLFLNHTNLRLPNSDVQSSDFGVVQSDVGPRVIQVALKFLFEENQPFSPTGEQRGHRGKPL